MAQSKSRNWLGQTGLIDAGLYSEFEKFQIPGTQHHSQFCIFIEYTISVCRQFIAP